MARLPRKRRSPSRSVAHAFDRDGNGAWQPVGCDKLEA